MEQVYADSQDNHTTEDGRPVDVYAVVATTEGTPELTITSWPADEDIARWPLPVTSLDGQLRIMADAEALVGAHREDLVWFSALRRTGWEEMGHHLAMARGGDRAGYWAHAAGDVGDRLGVAARALGDARGEVRGGVVSLV